MKKYNPQDFGTLPQDYTCNKQCSRCGNCCIPHLPITLNEYHTIKDYIHTNDIKEQPVFKDNNIYIDCPFHDRENKCCTIYPVRPKVCKNFICSSPLKKVDKDRKHYDKRADINGTHIDRICDMHLLFYHNPILSLLFAQDRLHADNPVKMLIALNKLAGDQKFLQKYNIPNTKEIADAIIRGDISLEWSDINNEC